MAGRRTHTRRLVCWKMTPSGGGRRIDRLLPTRPGTIVASVLTVLHPREVVLDQGMVDRINARVGHEIRFGGVGGGRCPVDQHMIPRLVQVWLRLVRHVPTVIGHTPQVDRGDYPTVAVASVSNELARCVMRTCLGKANHRSAASYMTGRPTGAPMGACGRRHAAIPAGLPLPVTFATKAPSVKSLLPRRRHGPEPPRPGRDTRRVTESPADPMGIGRGGWG